MLTTNHEQENIVSEILVNKKVLDIPNGYTQLVSKSTTMK